MKETVDASAKLYAMDDFMGINESGIHPVETVVLVKLDPVEDKTKGGIIIPEQKKERNQMAQTAATLIEAGGNAFHDWTGKVPKPGDRVLINKYSGYPPKAGDVESPYRLCRDVDITAVLE